MTAKWHKVGPHEYTLRMGPVVIEATRWGPIADDPAKWRDEWGFEAVLRVTRTRIARGHNRRRGARLKRCQTDAIRAVARWRDSIR